MNQSAPKSPHRQAPRPVDEPPSKAIRLLTGLLVLALVAMVAVLLVQRTREHPSDAVLQAGLRYMAVIDAVYRSAGTGRTVEVAA